MPYSAQVGKKAQKSSPRSTTITAKRKRPSQAVWGDRSLGAPPLQCFNTSIRKNLPAQNCLPVHTMQSHCIPRIQFGFTVILLAALLCPTAGAGDIDLASDTPCDLLMEQTYGDRWALLEYRSGPGGHPQSTLDITHFSDARFANQLLACIDRGEAQVPPPPTRSNGVYKVFRFAPARGQAEVRGARQLRYNVPPELRTQSSPAFEGYVGLRVEMNEFGMIRSKDLLFSSNGRLGEAILETLDEGLGVVKQGNEAGPYVDVIYLRFKDGVLVNFSQRHFVSQSTS